MSFLSNIINHLSLTLSQSHVFPAPLILAIVGKYITANVLFIYFSFNPMPPHVDHGLRGLPPGCG
jgi:hypothetical protein